MEAEQIKQQLEWLEDKRKQDAKTLEVMQASIKSLDEKVKSLDRKGAKIPAELTRLSENVARINQLDDALVRQREDISRQLNEFDASREKREKQKEKIEKKDRENQQKELSVFHGELEEARKAIEVLKQREYEDRRITGLLEEMKKQADQLREQVEASVHSSAVLEENRKHDMRRMGELAADTAAVQEKQEKYLVSQESIETRGRRLEGQLNRVVSREGERREELDVWMQQQQSRLLESERTWKEWLKKFEAFDDRANQIDERMQTYQETYLSMKQVGQDMTTLMDKLERRITEIAEMQRLSEDKIHKDLNVFLADDQKRWNTFKLTYEERWREHERMHEKLDNLVEDLSSTVLRVESATMGFERFSRKQILDILAVVRDWASERENV